MCLGKQYAKKNKLSPMFTAMLAKLISANFPGLFSARSLAIGIDEIASKPTIIANHVNKFFIVRVS